MSEGPLLCVVTGMEHSGTTFLSKLLTAHPTVNAAFECGILLGESPREVLTLEPWSDWFVTPIDEGHWGLTPAQFEEVAAASDWDGAYAKIVEHCPLFLEGENRIVDKSPRYLQDLPAILKKVPDAPCLVLEKDALLMFHSYKRRGFGVERFASYFNRCQASLREAEQHHSVLRVSQERLSANQSEVFRELCDYLDLEFDEQYVNRRWCKHNMFGISFVWLYKKPYDFEKARERANAEVTKDELHYLQKNLQRIGDDTMFAFLDSM